MTQRTTSTDHRANLAARRRRANRMRRGVAAGALTLFVGVWSGLSTQLAGAGSSPSAGKTTTTAVVAKVASTTASTAATATTPPAAASTSTS